MLDLRRLRALHAVVETGSVTGAAALLAYTPSAISQHITALQEETGTVLFERDGRGLRPTEAGRLLAAHAGGLLAKAAEAEAAMAALRAGELGVLRVASFPTAGAGLVPPALAKLRRRHPGVEVELRVAEREPALNLLRQGDADLVIIEGRYDRPAGADGLQPSHLLDDPFRVVLPRRHRLAHRRVIRLDELAAEAFVETTCTLDDADSALQAAYAQAGFQPRSAVQAAEYWPAQSFVAAGLGIALIPTLALEAVHDGVVIRRLHKSQEPVRHVWVVTRVAVAGHAPVRAMIEALTVAATEHRAAVDVRTGVKREAARPAPA
jgi:DNA-binding transcriptional LysR family regulator